MVEDDEDETKKPLWHVKKFECPNCFKPAQIMELAFNSAGGIFLGGICICCNKTVTWESNIFNIVSCCFTADGIVAIDGNETIH
jgi:hypothetical protein